jgi:hypothetical protein
MLRSDKGPAPPAAECSLTLLNLDTKGRRIVPEKENQIEEAEDAKPGLSGFDEIGVGKGK